IGLRGSGVAGNERGETLVSFRERDEKIPAVRNRIAASAADERHSLDHFLRGAKGEVLVRFGRQHGGREQGQILRVRYFAVSAPQIVGALVGQLLGDAQNSLTHRHGLARIGPNRIAHGSISDSGTLVRRGRSRLLSMLHGLPKKRKSTRGRRARFGAVTSLAPSGCFPWCACSHSPVHTLVWRRRWRSHGVSSSGPGQRRRPAWRSARRSPRRPGPAAVLRLGA